MLAITFWEAFFINLPAVIIAAGSATAAVLAAKRGKSNSEKIEDVHTLVNNKSIEQDTRIDQLGDALTKEGIAIPERKESNETK